MKKKEASSILVTGDFVLDHHIYEGRRRHFGDNSSPGVTVARELGGAALVCRLLERLLDSGDEGVEQAWRAHLAIDAPEPEAVAHSQRAYAFWRPFPADAGPDRQFWRVSEAMGFGPASAGPPCASWSPAKLSGSPQIIVAAEGGIGFRESKCCWEGLDYARARWIVLKTAAPVGEGPLWRHLSKNARLREKLIVVVSAPELRLSPLRLGEGLSWEDTLQGLIEELRSGGVLAELTKCRHLVVSFDSEAAVWMDFSGGRVAQLSVSYDAAAIEGDHARAQEGSVFGLSSCLAAAVAWRAAMTLRSDLSLPVTAAAVQPDLATALEGGLSAMRNLREQGHGRVSEVQPGEPGRADSAFPAARLAKVIKNPSHSYSRAFLRVRDGKLSTAGNKATGGPWSIMHEAHPDARAVGELARLAVLRGPIALESIPHLRIGKLLSVDRREIESLRTLEQVMLRYCGRAEKGKKPLSIGVFGPPGAGKSFAVCELASTLAGKDAWMEFNLSQFNAPEDLIGAFHQVRDRVLRGIVPVAFFDEFDSQSYRWLSYLLAPMQDGKFQEGQLTHTLGKCIFILAGGTSETFEGFGPRNPEAGSEPKARAALAASSGRAPRERGTAKIPQGDAVTLAEARKAWAAFRLAKGPDFKSRLDAYFDVVGPNPRKLAPGGAVDATDLYAPVRRALIIRAELGCAPEDKLDIEEGLLGALLHTRSYTHGARSLGKVLQPFKTQLPGPLCRSLLLPRTQLAMHVDAGDFLGLCKQRAAVPEEPPPLSADEIDAMAPAIHETWRELRRRQGTLEKADDKDYAAFLDGCEAELRSYYEGSNRSAAARIPRILSLVGLKLAGGKAEPAEEEHIRRRLEYCLELLAEAEHDGWMRWLISQGWRWGKNTDKSAQVHSCLLPYAKLGHADKNKDRSAVRCYPDFVRRVNKKIVFGGVNKS